MSQSPDTPRKLPGSLNTNRRLDRWLRIDRNGTVTAFPGKVEIGQGILTALSQIVAEELDVSLERIRLAAAGTSYSPDEGMTSGSQSITDGGAALRYAAAEARDLLLQRAAQQLGVSLEQLSVTDGVISARSGGSVTYWEIVTDDLLAREATGEIAPKPASQHTVIGASTPRRDIPPKVSGTPIFVHDLDFDGMLHGRVVRPPSYRARLAELDEARAPRCPGRGGGGARRQLPGRNRGARRAGGTRVESRPAQGEVGGVGGSARYHRSALPAEGADGGRSHQREAGPRGGGASGKAFCGAVHAALHRARRDRPLVRGSELRERALQRVDA